MKTRSVFTCNVCGCQAPKWQGQCPDCDAWNSFTESAVIPEAKKGDSRFTAWAAGGKLQLLSEVGAEDLQRTSTGSTEFDRVLGGGLISGGVVLIGGDPGIGKSTLLLQVLAYLSASHSTLYVSGEESAQQVALRAKRLSVGGNNLRLLPEIQLEKIQAAIAQCKPEFVVIDSIQTLWSGQLTSAPGSVAQVRECSAQLTRMAKSNNVTLFLVGHSTKENVLAGPRVLEHMVDTVLYFEGDTQTSFRVMRAFKNRYGAVNELAVLAMTPTGLRDVNNPSALFLSQHQKPVAGSCVLVTQEGTRPLLVEIQALVDHAQGNPRRLSLGLEQNRLAMQLAILHRHAGITCSDQDVFINAVGGVKISEPGADLAVILAVASSLRNRPLQEKMVAFGEVGLAGEVRPVQRGQERLKEAAKLGFTLALVPKANAPKHKISGIEIVALERVDEALDACSN